jgi:hypothetical protein
MGRREFLGHLVLKQTFPQPQVDLVEPLHHFQARLAIDAIHEFGGRRGRALITRVQNRPDPRPIQTTELIPNACQPFGGKGEVGPA